MEIEFIEHRSGLPDVPEAAPARARRNIWPAAAPAVALAAAAACAAAAPFQQLYRVQISTAGFTERVTVDGWGRTAFAVTNGAGTTQHGPRYGIVLVAIAAVCGLLALAVGYAVVRGARSGVGPVLAGAVVSAALGVAVAMAWLDAKSQLDQARQLSDHHSGNTLAERVDVNAAYGPCPWLALAALGCALVGTALAAGYARRAPAVLVAPPDALEPPPAAPERPAAAPVPRASEEDLGEELSW